MTKVGEFSTPTDKLIKIGIKKYEMILMFLKIIETLKISFEMKLWTLFFLVPYLTIWSVLQTEFRPICKKCQNTQFT